MFRWFINCTFTKFIDKHQWPPKNIRSSIWTKLDESQTTFSCNWFSLSSSPTTYNSGFRDKSTVDGDNKWTLEIKLIPFILENPRGSKWNNINGILKSNQKFSNIYRATQGPYCLFLYGTTSSKKAIKDYSF